MTFFIFVYIACGALLAFITADQGETRHIPLYVLLPLCIVAWPLAAVVAIHDEISALRKDIAALSQPPSTPQAKGRHDIQV